MSRFYDVLREAGRHQSNGSTAATPAVDPPPSARGVEEFATATEKVEAALPADSPDPQERPPEAISEVGITLQAPLDRTARVIPYAADPIVVEHYRRLRTKLLQEHEIRPFRLLMVTSPNPQEGKTVTALNLALSFSMLENCKVLFIDGDLRKGRVGKWFGVDGRQGLSNLLNGAAQPEDVILRCADYPMHVLLRGNCTTPPPELLNCVQLRDSMRELSDPYDIVIVDSPPLNLVTDAQLLAQCCDAVLVVARAFSTTRKGLKKAVQDLQPFRVIGAVLNGGSPGELHGRYKGYY